MSWFRFLAALLLAGLLAGVPVCRAAGNLTPKVALVIGNQRYSGDKPLPNAANDASLMARTLTRLGFTVTERHDLSKSDLVTAVTEFADRIPEGATALVYYAGHGMQLGGSNFLNPVDMQITSEQTAALRAYPLKALLERLALSRSAVNIVVLDACRNNPFRTQGPIRYRGFGDFGLVKVQAPRGTLIAYSTAPGQLAADGNGPNSLYTATLARLLAEPGQEVEDIFKQVSTEVRRKTLDDQIPWYESSLTDRFYFQPPDGISIVAGRPLKYAAAGNQGSSEIRRGAEAGPGANGPWYRQLKSADWSQVDWEIQQRVKRLTPDEIPLLEHKAQGGNVLAQTTLGLAYREGLEKAVHTASGQVMRFKANNTRALQWLKKGAAAGFPVAQTELAEMYYAGHGVDRDLRTSRLWLERAVAADYPRAKLDLLQLNMETRPQEADIGAAFNSMMESLRQAPSQQVRPRQ